jgi:hypothetical protein
MRPEASQSLLDDEWHYALEIVLCLELVPGFVQDTKNCPCDHTLLGRGVGRNLTRLSCGFINAAKDNIPCQDALWQSPSCTAP